MFGSRRSADVFFVLTVAATVLAWNVRQADASQSALCACICQAVKDYLKPTRSSHPTPQGPVSVVKINGTHKSGSTEHPPPTDKPPTDMQKFAMEVRRCVKNHGSGGQVTNLQCECILPDQDGDGKPETYTIDVSADVDGDAVSNAGSADIVVAVAGNKADGSSQDGPDATATNSSAGGAAVACGGNGGGNDDDPGDGGKGSAPTSRGDSVGIGGAGGDPADNEKPGGGGGGAWARQTIFGSQGIASSDGVSGGPDTYHGGGAWAKCGRIDPGLPGDGWRAGHGGSRTNDNWNTNVP